MLAFWGLAQWDVATRTWASGPLTSPTSTEKAARVGQLDIVIEQWRVWLKTQVACWVNVCEN